MTTDNIDGLNVVSVISCSVKPQRAAVETDQDEQDFCY